MPVAKESLSEAFPVEQPMQTVLILLSIQGVLGAFDNLWNHEIKERLPSRPTARLELTLHALRQVIYAIVFATIGWWRWDGLYAIALATLLTVEIVITLWDFVEEDRARKLSALERVTHGLLTLNYGAVLGLLAIELAAWLAEPSAFTPVDHGALSWLMTFYGAGVLAWALRDAIAVLRLSELRTPKWLRDPIAIQPIQRPMSVLVAGGTGFIGEALCRRLIAEGHHVTVATRNRAKAAHLFGPLARIVEHAHEIPQNEPIDVVVNLAGARIVGLPWTKARRRVLLESRLATTQELVDWMAQRMVPPHTLVNGSAIGFYGRCGEESIDETSHSEAGFMAELCVAWERIARKAERAGIRVVLLRTGLVLDRDGGTLAPMRRAFRAGLGGRMGDGQQWMSWIHRRDLIDLILHLIADTSITGPVNATAPSPCATPPSRRRWPRPRTAPPSCTCRRRSCARSWARCRTCCWRASAWCRRAPSRAATAFASTR